MKKIRFMNHYLFDVAAAPFVLGALALLGIAAAAVALVVVAIVLIVRAGKKRRAAAAAPPAPDGQRTE